MSLLKGGVLVDDTWIDVADDAPIYPETSIVVSLERWLSEADVLRARQAPVGVRLRNDQSPAQLAEDLDAIDLVVLEFPKYTDGRAYSAARLLRDRYGFEGEVRAAGHVLKDQYAFMIRCGFDAFEIDDSEDTAAWLSASQRMSLHYQPAADGAQAVWARRHAGL